MSLPEQPLNYSQFMYVDIAIVYDWRWADDTDPGPRMDLCAEWPVAAN